MRLFSRNKYSESGEMYFNVSYGRRSAISFIPDKKLRIAESVFNPYNPVVRRGGNRHLLDTNARTRPFVKPFFEHRFERVCDLDGFCVVVGAITLQLLHLPQNQVQAVQF